MFLFSFLILDQKNYNYNGRYNLFYLIIIYKLK